MARKHHKPEEIVGKLRQVDALKGVVTGPHRVVRIGC
jgi:hypothetical protein